MNKRKLWLDTLKKPMKVCLNCGRKMGMFGGAAKWCKESCKLEFKRNNKNV